MKRATMLMVDDDVQILQSMSVWLREQGFVVETASSVAGAIAALDKRKYDVLLVDIRLGEGDGFDVLAHARKHRPETLVIMLTGYGTVETAIEAIRAGAFDLLTKPLLDDELLMSLERALNHRKVIEENQQLKTQLDMRYGLDNVIGHDVKMRKVFDVIDSVADTRATVLVTGESGSGKSLLARAIHRRSGRRDKPFVELACGALPETLLESELFGHVAGAFTGATHDKAGKFALADGGTIFLDEIATATPALQVKLLRVLQEHEFEPVGGAKTMHVDVRVILATNSDLEAMVREGKFRQDLFYRVNVINVELPPLRERISDIPALAQHFFDRVREETGKKVRGISDEAMSAMQRYGWPGNVRELQNVVERGVLLGKHDLLLIDDLPASLRADRPIVVEPLGERTLKKALEGPERQIIREVLDAHQWNRHATAETLGINRTTLYKKMKRLGLDDGRGPDYHPAAVAAR